MKEPGPLPQTIHPSPKPRFCQLSKISHLTLTKGARLRLLMRNSTHHDEEPLTNINQALTDGISAQGVFQSILHEAIRLCGAERGFLLRDTNDVVAALNADRGDYSRDFVKTVRGRKTPLMGIATSGDRRLARHQEKSPQISRSVISAPFITQGVLEGVIYLDKDNRKSSFDKEDLRALADLTAQALVAFQLAILKHVEDKTEAEDEYLSALTNQDRLTGLVNRRVLNEQLESIFSDPRQLPTSLLLFDIDDFEHYNERNGRTAGDEVLKRIGLLLSSSLRAPDLPARISGETFAVLLPQTDLESAAAVANRIYLSITKTAFPFASAQPLGKLTITLGLASAPEHGKNPESLIDVAEQVLKAAKSAGKNRISAAS